MSLNYSPELLTLMVSEKKLGLFYHESMGANDTLSVANLDLMGNFDKIYVDNHYALLHTKYRSCRTHGFRKDDFLKSFSPFSLWRLMTLRIWPV